MITRRQVILHTDRWGREKVKLGARCKKCKSNEELSVDHIIPRSILLQFGFKYDSWIDEDNLQILCRGCNRTKGNLLDFSEPKTLKLLKKYIGLVEKELCS